MHPFDFQLRPRIVFGAGAIQQLGDLARASGGRRALIVSDRGVVSAGHYDKGKQALEAAGLETFSFHDFGENPTTDMVQAGVDFARQVQPDILIGLGGGSSMDCCKGINFVYSCGGTMHDYRGVGKATADMVPMIAVPTTAGTGSEAQSFALISDAQTHVKMACGDPRAACRVALLDPELTLTQPAAVTALTGIDAISHAVETYVTKPRNAMSLTFSRRAFGLLANGFPKVLADPNDLEARSQMQVGSCLAGLAIETSMLGAAHAVANPLTARFDIVHGQAVGVMLPHVVRMNGSRYEDWYAELLAEVQPVRNLENAAGQLADLLTGFLDMAGLKQNLSQLAVNATAIDELSQAAAEQWTGTFNPIPLDRDRITGLYQSAM
ncbi:NAD-dependent methanol dehydrogenase [Roseimaritima multifibrata]|uniref:NAD-dependent methanol dehydrogenase n=1 Tax=Roseimaritima multifibrata TaxID=1930274 RepID=A0A517MBI4_9BACT|nr:iron-containing alcohol dehydrogenase [Roseimaritima multifibrata]QDS92137.1 NAD-dependent methanol dehydrogenase [Roseimaritima multifibrata]